MKLIDKIKNEHNEFTKYNQLKIYNNVDIANIFNNEVQYENDLSLKAKKTTLSAIGVGAIGAVLCFICLPAGLVVGGAGIVIGGVGNYLIDKPHKLKQYFGRLNKKKNIMSELRMSILETMDLVYQIEEACDKILSHDVKNTQQFLDLLENKRAIIKDRFNQIEESFVKLRKLKKNENDIKEISELITVYTKTKLYIDEYETKYENALKNSLKDRTLNSVIVENQINNLRETYPLTEFNFETNNSRKERGR